MLAENTPGWCDEHAVSVEECAQQHENGAQSDDDTGRRLIVQSAAEIRPRRVTWLWDGRIAAGTLSLLAGREGLGKSTLTAWLVAQVTRGTLPGGQQGTPRSAIIAATEDSWEYTLVPRLIAAGADLAHVLRVDVETAAGFTTGLSLPRDLPALADTARDHDVALLVMDPLMSRLDGLDTHRDAEVRLALEPLVRVADEAGMAILGLIHVNKNTSADPLNAVMGSKAFTAVARSVSTVIADPEDEDDRRRLFGTVKNNLGPALPSSQVFTVESTTVPSEDGPIDMGCLAWHGEVDLTIKAAMADPGMDTRSATTEACDWLEDYLSMYPGTPRVEVMRAGVKAGHAERTVKRAAERVGVHAETSGFPRRSTWSLAVQSDPLQSGQQSGQAPGESVYIGLTGPTGDDLHKRSAPVGPVGPVGPALQTAGPTDGPTAQEQPCEVCGAPSIYPIHPTCEELTR
ncbi:AAA family ATPase [Brachybacterium tyrofermentans]|uniref:AAA family ATPase n=1 Tax=Brachybacterium tyrofermentans TaxID=47848 RepID=UPI003FD4A7CA